jgi:molybdate transport system substrate-binding protein
VLAGAGSAVFLAGCGAGAGGDGQRGDPLLVLAASDLQNALPEIVARYEAATGIRSTLVFGSTGNLAAQIAQGAPGDLFLAANERFVDRLGAAGHLREDTRGVYAIGRLAVVLAPGAPRAEGLEALADPRFRTVAIANPEHAPYGAAAREALTAAGLWATLERRLVYGENVSQALQFVLTGNADAGLVALGILAGLPEVRHLVVDEALHRPLTQTGVVLRGSSRASAARQLLEFIVDEEGQAILRRFGFEEPSR